MLLKRINYLPVRNAGVPYQFVKRYCSNHNEGPQAVDSAATTAHEVSTNQELYITDPISPGSIFFLPNGTKIFNKLVSFMKLQQQNKYGFQEVVTPLIYRKTLWEQSGHWENYKDDMFRVEGNDLSKEEYGLKPMNCPGHCVVFKRFDRSYNELPLRFSDFSPLHRNEASGALSGLTRVRKFHQDDGHIFCTPDQVRQEIQKCLELVDMCYTKVFPISGDSKQAAYSLTLSTRPEKYVGDIEVWNHAEDVLKDTLQSWGQSWTTNEGDGAFYGPKIDILVNDHTGKSHQVATIQLDFQLPERFDLQFKDKDNSYKRPIMIHRAVFGSVERFMAILIDSSKGKWPFWLNPNQCMVIPVKTEDEKIMELASKTVNSLRAENSDPKSPIPLNSFHFSVDMDARDESVSKRIREAIKKHYSYIIMIGDKEVEAGKVAIRTRESKKVDLLTIEDVFERFVDLEKNYK
ncbi:Mst1 [Kluyveromyces lactis]|nr:Mst1 [Kluyveromyces lactis]